MGLDPAQLKIDPQWLPFYRSGLRYILRSGRERTGSCRASASASNGIRETWLSWLEQLSSPRSVVLTYWKLCQDRAERQDEQSRQRRDLFARMLAGLGWPRSEYAFWPVSDCPEGDIHADTDLFRQGIRSLRPRYVIVFGAEASRAVFPHLDPYSRRTESEGISYLFLPDPDEMLPDNREAKNLVWRELKALPLASGG